MQSTFQIVKAHFFFSWKRCIWYTSKSWSKMHTGFLLVLCTAERGFHLHTTGLDMEECTKNFRPFSSQAKQAIVLIGYSWGKTAKIFVAYLLCIPVPFTRCMCLMKKTWSVKVCAVIQFKVPRSLVVFTFTAIDPCE